MCSVCKHCLSPVKCAIVSCVGFPNVYKSALMSSSTTEPFGLSIRSWIQHLRLFRTEINNSTGCSSIRHQKGNSFCRQLVFPRLYFVVSQMCFQGHVGSCGDWRQRHNVCARSHSPTAVLHMSPETNHSGIKTCLVLWLHCKTPPFKHTHADGVTDKW